MADDDSDDQEFLKMAVHQYSKEVRVECVPNGIELMNYLKNEEQPDLIILDLNMPQKDGRTALSEIKTNEELKHIPILIYTTSTSPFEINQIYQLGANSFLSKPKSFNDIILAIHQICNYWLKTITLPKLSV
jgi:CheY-like chemotaxis protein